MWLDRTGQEGAGCPSELLPYPAGKIPRAHKPSSGQSWASCYHVGHGGKDSPWILGATSSAVHQSALSCFCPISLWAHHFILQAALRPERRPVCLWPDSLPNLWTASSCSDRGHSEAWFLTSALPWNCLGEGPYLWGPPWCISLLAQNEPRLLSAPVAAALRTPVPQPGYLLPGFPPSLWYQGICL